MKEEIFRLYRPSKESAATEKQLNYIRALMWKKNIKFPFETNIAAKGKLDKYTASKIIDALLNGKQINKVLPSFRPQVNKYKFSYDDVFQC